MRLHPAVIAGMSAAVLMAGCGQTPTQEVTDPNLPTEHQISSQSHNRAIKLVEEIRAARAYDREDPNISIEGVYNVGGQDILRTRSKTVGYVGNYTCKKEVIWSVARYEHGNPANVKSLVVTDLNDYTRGGKLKCSKRLTARWNYQYKFDLSPDAVSNFYFSRNSEPLDRLSFLTNVFSLMDDAETVLEKSLPADTSG